VFVRQSARRWTWIGDQLAVDVVQRDRVMITRVPLARCLPKVRAADGNDSREHVTVRVALNTTRTCLCVMDAGSPVAIAVISLSCLDGRAHETGAPTSQARWVLRGPPIVRARETSVDA